MIENKETRDFTKSEAVNWIYNNNLGWVFPHYDKNGNCDYLICKAPPVGLKLPDGWYYSDKNGFTNKHNSSTGAYACIDAVYTGS